MRVEVRRMPGPWDRLARGGLCWRWRMFTDSGGYFEGRSATQPEALNAGCAALHVWSRPS